MFKTSEYLRFGEITAKVMELEQLNRKIDINKLSKISSVNNEIINEFIATNNIEGDVTSFDMAKHFLKQDEILSDNDLEKRWIGIKYASDVIWEKSFSLNMEYLNEAHRALMSKTSTVGGILKQKSNQVGTLITTLPEDVPSEMFNLLSSFMPAYLNESSVYQVIPFLSEFLAIHPYEDGNGRMSRLLTNKLFYDMGYKFTKYISISKFLWDNKETYIEALESRNRAWERKDIKPEDLIPLFLVVIDSLIAGAKKALAYLNLKKYTKVDFSNVLKKVLMVEMSYSTIIENLMPSNSTSTIKTWIKEILDNGEIVKTGTLRTTKYKVSS